MTGRLAQLTVVLDECLARVRNQAHAPALMWSGGKDSMVLLHRLYRVRGWRWPLIQHRWPGQAQRWAWVERLVREWDLALYDWPPADVTLQQHAGRVEPVAVYAYGADRQGQSRLMAVPINLYEPEQLDAHPDEPWACVVHDCLERPRGFMRTPWDVLVHGHKSSDVDPLWGPVPITADVARLGPGQEMVFPLRGWTDPDVWTYLTEHHVPVDPARYDVAARQEHADKRSNPDYLAACARCVNATLPASVSCPRWQAQVHNQGPQLKTDPIPRPSYFQRLATQEADTAVPIQHRKD